MSQNLFVTVELGDYKCSSASSSALAKNDETLCALKDKTGEQSLPPVNISVNFGDGSGEQRWSREDPRHLWSHQYTLPGSYWVSVASENIALII